MPSLGAPELLIILVVVVMIFGVGKLPEVGSSLGKGIREFRRASTGTPEGPAPSSPQTAQPVATYLCQQCGSELLPSAHFCIRCGTPAVAQTLVQSDTHRSVAS
jgi:sec-independent protein translocase protein TatA